MQDCMKPQLERSANNSKNHNEPAHHKRRDCAGHPDGDSWVCFITAHSDAPVWKRFYTYVPPLLLCYFLPSVFSTLGVYSGDVSKLYTTSAPIVASAFHPALAPVGASGHAWLCTRNLRWLVEWTVNAHRGARIRSLLFLPEHEAKTGLIRMPASSSVSCRTERDGQRLKSAQDHAWTPAQGRRRNTQA